MYNDNWQWIKIGTSWAKVPSEDIIKSDLDRIDRSIEGFIVKDINGYKSQFYDFDTARKYRDANGGFMYPALIDPQKTILGIKEGSDV